MIYRFTIPPMIVPIQMETGGCSHGKVRRWEDVSVIKMFYYNNEYGGGVGGMVWEGETRH